MPHLTWLHLSDWHQRGEDFDGKVVRDRLIDDLKNRQSLHSELTGIDFVIFSGDLAYSGLSREFEAARENLLSPVLETLRLTPDRLFIVPGNHDLQRSVISDMLPVELQAPLDSDDLVSKWLTDARKRQRALEPFEDYTHFVEKYVEQNDPAFASVKQFTSKGIDVGLLGLNSAWMCGRHKEADGEVNDYGFIVVGEPQIHDSLREIESATIRIAVLHHPFKWLKAFEQNKIEKRLKEACHFILRGHEHEADADWSTGPQGECMVIPAGASYDRRNAFNSRYVNGYNFVHLDLEKSSGAVFFRKWSEKRTAWIEDIDSCSGGQLLFVLPKRLSSASSSQYVRVSNTIEMTDLTELEADYRRQTIETFKDLSFKGLTASVRPILLPLKEVYVQLRAVAEVPESADEFTPEERRVLRWMEDQCGDFDQESSELREAQMHLDALRRERWTKERLERFPIAEALTDPGRRGLVILGDPGSGKTTLLHFLALVFAGGRESVSDHLNLVGDEADRLPIFAPLAAYDDMLNQDPSLTVQSFLAKYYASRRAMPRLEKLFESAIEKGQALILLDGMDEVLDEARRKFVADQASAFIRTLIHRGNRVLLTSRIYGYRVAPLSVELPHVTVLDFRRDEIEVFARQWSNAMAQWEYSDRSAAERFSLAQDEERALLREIKSNPGVERLAANPLLLSMLALLRRQVGTLPQQRIRLYDLYLRTLIDAWEASRSPGARVDLPLRPGAGKVELVLIPLALWLQQNRPSGTATEAEILAQIRIVFLQEDGLAADTAEDSPAWAEAQERAREFLDQMRGLSGLIVERGHSVFGFRHLTFQEYYVARALARMEASKRWQLLQPNLHANRWREPILLAAAQLGNIQADEELCTAFVNQILDAGSPHEHILHRDLFLAADCAADDINVRIITLRRIVDRLHGLATSNIPTLISETIRRLVLLALLSSAGKPRLPEIADVLNAMLLAPNSSQVLPLHTFIELTNPLFQRLPQLRESLLQRLQMEPSYAKGVGIIALKGSMTDVRLRTVVTDMLRDESVYVRSSAIRALAELVSTNESIRSSVIHALNDEHGTIRTAAVEALRDAIAGDQSLRRTITHKLADPWYSVRAAAIQALIPFISHDLAVREAVLNKLEDVNGPTRAVTVEALAPLLSNDLSLMPQIISKLSDDYFEVRSEAVRAVSSFLTDQPKLRVRIQSMLDDSDYRVRATVVSTLKNFLSEDRILREEIVKKLDDPVHDVRAAAINCLLQFSEHRTSIQNLLGHPDWKTRLTTVVALSDPFTVEAVATDISQLFSDLRCVEAKTMRVGAVLSLGKVASQNIVAYKAIAEKLSDDDYDIQAAAIEAAASLLAQDPELRRIVTLKLDHESLLVRAAAIRGLAGSLGTEPVLQTALRQKLLDGSDFVRAAAVVALAPLVTEDNQLRMDIAQRLTDEVPTVRAAAIAAIATALSHDQKLRHLVVDRINDEVYYVKVAAIRALSSLLLQHKELKETIERVLLNEEDAVRAAAIQALASFVPEDERLSTLCVRFLLDDSPAVRSAATNVLTGEITNNQKLRLDLEHKLNDTADEVRVGAIQAMAVLLANEPPLQRAMAEKLNDRSDKVRLAVIAALKPLVTREFALRDAVVRSLVDESDEVRAAAILALVDVLKDDGSLRQTIAKMLTDKSVWVRLVACEALAPFVNEDDIRNQLRPGLAMEDSYVRGRGLVGRDALVASWAKWTLSDPTGVAEAIEMLHSTDWRLRLSGAEILMAGGPELVNQAVPELLQATDNQAGLDSFPARIAAAEALINYSEYSQAAVDVLISALDYGTNPLMIVMMANEIRRTAALVLGKLKAEECQLEAVSKLKTFVETERQPQVLDGLFNAILSLASAPAPPTYKTRE